MVELVFSLCGWVMGAAAPMAPPKEENEDKQLNQQWSKKANTKNEQTKIKSNESICGIYEMNEAN